MSNTNNKSETIETKDTVSSCSVSKDQEIQRLQEKAQLTKGSSMSGLKALQSHFTKLGISSSTYGNDMKVDEADIRPTYDADSLERVENDDCNVFAMEKEDPKQPESVSDTYLVEQGDSNTTLDSSYMSNNGREPTRMI
nr:hypothetical protein [Tanacetum cinerariifolium]